MKKCAKSKALILVVADDDRRVARLIGAGHSSSAVMANMSEAFKIRTYTKKEKAIAGLAALGVGGCEFLQVANCGGILPSYDTTVVDMKFEDPLHPGITPKTTFILERLPNHPDPLCDYSVCEPALDLYCVKRLGSPLCELAWISIV